MVVTHAVKPRDDVVLNDLEKYVVSGENGEDETFQFVEIVTNSFESNFLFFDKMFLYLYCKCFRVNI